MKEYELNVYLDVISDPVKCAYDTTNYKDLLEIQRIIKIFQINKEQHNHHKHFSIKNLVALKVQLSNN